MSLGETSKLLSEDLWL